MIDCDLIKVVDLGTKDYKESWELQEQLFNELIEGKKDGKLNSIAGKLFLVEHPHVYTLGKSGDESNLLINAIQLQAQNAQFYKTNRGGDITYHGPGQCVGYPVLDLDVLDIGLRKYIELLEEVIILVMKDYGLKGERDSCATGVWLDVDNPKKARKICAIGVRSSRFVTMHGFAFNVNTDLKYFDYINPCGFVDKGVTSLENELGYKVSMAEIHDKIIHYVNKLFLS